MKKIILAFITISALLWLPACRQDSPPVQEAVSETSMTPEPQAMTTLRMNRSANMSYAPIFIAEEEGYFAEYGIVLEMIDFNRTAEAIPLVVSGDLDAYAGSVNAGLLNTLYLEPNIRVVADRGRVRADMECTFQGILVRKDLYDSGAVLKPEDVRGLTMVSSTAGPGAFLTAEFLKLGGLTFEDVNITDIPPATYTEAMLNASVDLICAVELPLGRVLASGSAVQIASMEDVVGDFQTSILAFGKNLLTDNPELGARFLAAYLKGVAQYNEGKTERNLEILAEATGDEIEVLKNSCWLPISLDGIPDFNAIVAFMNWSISAGHLEQPITEEQFWNPKPLEAAMKLLGK